MKLSIPGVVVLGSLLLCGCSAQDGNSAVPEQAEIQSIHTGLTASACKTEIDKTDPNETPYLVCPGVAGYSLIVRRVGSGRRSIDIVDPAERAFPLDYQEVVTRHMASLGDQAEWRVSTSGENQVPIALLVRVQAHEDNDDPEQVTTTYLAVAKITPNETCVTDSIPEGTQSETEVRNVADSAAQRQCAPPQPPITEDSATLR